MACHMTYHMIFSDPDHSATTAATVWPTAALGCPGGQHDRADRQLRLDWVGGKYSSRSREMFNFLVSDVLR